jgi:AcrR family transcriptional regulator
VSTSNRSPYHHGALKEALLHAAESMLDEGGVEAVNLREAARRAGVSPTAPYRHFVDKEALLAALAARGFAAFGRALEDAARGASAPMAAMGRAYVTFALARPGRFRLMFGAALGDRSRYPELHAAAMQAFDTLRTSARKTRADVEFPALRAWCVVHGLAHLLLDGMLPGTDPEALIRGVVLPERAAG